MSSALALRTDVAAPALRQPIAITIVPSVETIRAVYRPAQRPNPVALMGAVGIVAAITASIAMVKVVTPAREHHPLKVFAMDLAPPPPPAADTPPAVPTTPVETVPTPPAAVTPPPPLPVPVVQTPAPVTVVALPPAPVPAPARPAQSASPAVSSAHVAAPPVPSVASPMEGGDLSAKMIAAPAPSYPMECRRRHEQGIVKLLVLVGVDGKVDTVSVAATSGSFRLDRAALGAVKQWRWSPVRRDGEAVMVRGFVTIPFVLKA